MSKSNSPLKQAIGKAKGSGQYLVLAAWLNGRNVEFFYQAKQFPIEGLDSVEQTVHEVFANDRRRAVQGPERNNGVPQPPQPPPE